MTIALTINGARREVAARRAAGTSRKAEDRSRVRREIGVMTVLPIS